MHQKAPMAKYTYVLLIIMASCASAESPALLECRQVQENIVLRTSLLDSSLNSHVSALREQCNAMSVDTLLATDSLRRKHYSNLKESVALIEEKQTEMHRWKSGLILLPTREEIASGIRNPFGKAAGDAGILQALNTYSDTLTILEKSITELINSHHYE
jgi:hypothetical protein